MGLRLKAGSGSSADSERVNMSGLNKIELEGCLDLLGLMETSEILALFDTITNRLVQPQDRRKKREKNPEQFDDCYKLGEEFCQWFFELLNSQNPFFRPPQEKWGPQHFWVDVKLKFCYNTSEQNVMDYHGSELVSLRLLSLVKEEFLFLNLNLDCNRLKCVSSPHGLVVVAVTGTVHRGSMCLGIFEQVFGLIRSPFLVNTWKIKFVNLSIVGKNSLEPGVTLEKPSITLESKELEPLYNGNGATCSRNEALLTETPILCSRSGNQALCHENEASCNNI
ncbi:LOW QUALITY PROTEIN: uncharacterized protein C3orf38 homolog [Sminthopsis crassicaudata]|uniref:LOW QUALITY PROTEIN: uncharacterized protein C3orf38 homolog n=1 Tax=Sminthopsis crassicaudata TaxID=9301 RepID=UPI003D6998FE